MGCCASERNNPSHVDFLHDSPDNARPTVMPLPSLILPSQVHLSGIEVAGAEIYTDKQLTETKGLMQEIFNTERSYIQVLYKIFELFLHPLWKYRMINASHIAKFDCIKDLWQFHKSFMERLCDDVDSPTPGVNAAWQDLSSWPDKMAPLYEAYISQYEDMIRTVTEIRRKSPSINSHFNAQDRPFDAFIICPLQRITRYKLLFANLQSCTPPHHPDFVHISHIVDRFSEILNDINAQRARQLHLLQVGAKLSNLNQPFATHNRTLIAEQPCFFAKQNQRPGHFVLCSDCLLFCRSDWSVFVWINLKKIELCKQVGDHLNITRRMLRPSLSPLRTSPGKRRLSKTGPYSEESCFIIYANSEAQCKTWYDQFFGDIEVWRDQSDYSLQDSCNDNLPFPAISPESEFLDFGIEHHQALALSSSTLSRDALEEFRSLSREAAGLKKKKISIGTFDTMPSPHDAESVSGGDLSLCFSDDDSMNISRPVSVRKASLGEPDPDKLIMINTESPADIQDTFDLWPHDDKPDLDLKAKVDNFAENYCTVYSPRHDTCPEKVITWRICY